jgi:hypothetical protein
MYNKNCENVCKPETKIEKKCKLNATNQVNEHHLHNINLKVFMQ